MKYGIAVNPVAGSMSIDEKYTILNNVKKILGNDCIIRGLDTKSKQEFCECARDLSKTVENLVGAGGDGTAGDVINCINSNNFGYIPFGSGNGLAVNVGLPRAPLKAAERIRNGKVHSLDLILSEGKKAFVASIGVDGWILDKREKYVKAGKGGLLSYVVPGIKAVFGCRRINADIVIDGKHIYVPRIFTLVITKAAYYGYGINVVPKAKMDDGYLHGLYFNSSLVEAFFGFGTAVLGENRTGKYLSGKEIQVAAKQDAYLQLNGDLEKKGTEFEFKVLPKELKIIY